MNTRPPSDDELDRLLASRPKRTSPEFEQRWRELRATLVSPAPRARFSFGYGWLWSGVALTALAVGIALRQAPPRAAEVDGAAFEQLLALDAALSPGAPLLDPEDRAAILYLPLQAKP